MSTLEETEKLLAEMTPGEKARLVESQFTSLRRKKVEEIAEHIDLHAKPAFDRKDDDI